MFIKRLPCLSGLFRRSSHVLAVALAAVLGACAHAPQAHSDMAKLAQELPRYSYSLMGEVHDNAQGHALREHVLKCY